MKNREQEAGNREQEAGNREQEAGNREQEAGNRSGTDATSARTVPCTLSPTLRSTKPSVNRSSSAGGEWRAYLDGLAGKMNTPAAGTVGSSRPYLLGQWVEDYNNTEHEVDDGLVD